MTRFKDSSYLRQYYSRENEGFFYQTSLHHNHLLNVTHQSWLWEGYKYWNQLWQYCWGFFVTEHLRGHNSRASETPKPDSNPERVFFDDLWSPAKRKHQQLQSGQTELNQHRTMTASTLLRPHHSCPLHPSPPLFPFLYLFPLPPFSPHDALSSSLPTQHPSNHDQYPHFHPTPFF